MATIYQLKTFSDIYTAVREELGVQVGDIISLNKIKRTINMIYIDEIVSDTNWKWLSGVTNVTHEPYISAGTAVATSGSTTVVLTNAPAISRQGHYFAVNDYNEIYRIAQHTAGSTTVTLEVPYTGNSVTTAGYKIWTDRIPLPANLRETIKVTHSFQDVPLEAAGLQKYREIVSAGPKLEGRPFFYCTNNYTNPTPYSSIVGLPSISTRASSGLVKTLTFVSDVSTYLKEGYQIEIFGSPEYSYNGRYVVSSVSGTTITYTGKVSIQEAAISDIYMSVNLLNNATASEDFRDLMVHPSVFNARTTLQVDYSKMVMPLELDTDEPLVPYGDRTIIFYGALSLLWSSIGRNPEEGQRNQSLFERKLAAMMGKTEDSFDSPVLRPSKNYLATKRAPSRVRDTRYGRGAWTGGGSGGSSSSATPYIGTASTVAVFNAQGELQGSPIVTTDELARIDGLMSAAVGTTDNQVLTNKTIDSDSNIISNIANLNIKAAAGIVYSKLVLTASIINADIATSAAIAYSKLSLAASIVNADVATAAGIVYSKLNLSGSIQNTDIANGAGIATSKINLKAPTVQKFTSSSGTYTTPSSPVPLYIKVTMVGGGGGGAGGGATATAGGNGGNTTFGTTLLVANGGTGGVQTATPVVGGTTSLGTGPVGIAIAGAGATSQIGQAGNPTGGGAGASSALGGGGAGAAQGAAAGTAAATNSGSGGGGGGAPSGANGGGGGAAGGYVHAIIIAPTTSYSYAVGAAGTAGTLGTSGGAGAAGGAGLILVEEFYQ